MFYRSLFTIFSLLFFWIIFSGSSNASDSDDWINTPTSTRPLTACDAAIKLDPNNDVLRLKRAEVLVATDKRDLAATEIAKAIEINPKNDQGHFLASSLSVRQHDYSAALKSIDKAVALNPNNEIYYYLRGYIQFLLGDFDGATTSLDRSIALSPQYQISWIMRAETNMERRQFDAAIKDATEAIRLQNGPGVKLADTSSYRMRAQIEIRIQDYDAAISDLSQAIGLSPQQPSTKIQAFLLSLNYVQRGVAWRMKGNMQNSLDDLNKAVMFAPDRIPGLNARGETLRYIGKFDDAIADFKKSLSLLADNTPALFGLGMTYERTGDLASARSYFDRTLRSQDPYRTSGDSRLALESARARLAALDAGSTRPNIPPAPLGTSNPTTIPTPLVQTPGPIKTLTLQGRRVALVIGNSAYQNVPALANPEKDAKAVAQSLRNIGFEVVSLEENDTREKLLNALRSFATEAEKSDWAIVYYAGHGMEVGGVNYLVPVDAKIEVDRDIQFEAVPLDQVLAAVDSAKKLKLIMLDACRDNPFKPRETATADRVSVASTAGSSLKSRSIGRGLAEVKVAGATLVVYAAKDGQVALDGEGGNSPFAVAVAQRIATPGVEINKVFRLVRDDVLEATAGRQEP